MLENYCAITTWKDIMQENYSPILSWGSSVSVRESMKQFCTPILAYEIYHVCGGLEVIGWSQPCLSMSLTQVGGGIWNSIRWWCEVYLPPCQWQPWECMWQKDRQGKCKNYHNQKIELPWFVTSNWSPCFTAGHMLVCSWLPRQPTMP